MTDDDLIMLWSLAGMELWAEFKQIDIDHCVIWSIEREWSARADILCVNKKIRWKMVFSYSPDDPDKLVATIDDILSFNPNERWWKLLFAKRWYEQNKEQFND